MSAAKAPARYRLNGASFVDVWSAWDSVPALRAQLKPLSFAEAVKRLAALGMQLTEIREVA